ncbi:uncharacterized protein TM35_000222870 [Trypanosoma theileri]|uniref:Suppressor of forked domain-containing protein n=1 Tax=Trypanosoma theileri TaxID=67003 RepID=A0A1X0NSF8_9TRYP|nr:uncharacterized protein TM35_000222870 [Trypanosoma theileri]ORC87488.1 hypothetical protein TM35_000222870 [Trypanosoma theileri]
MDDDNLRDLMNRLRFATGKGGDFSVAETVSTHIDQKSLLVIQQSLRRHPALVLIDKSRDELKKYLMDQIQDSLQSEASTHDDVGRLLGWINETSESLEIERLSAVYCDPEEVLNEIKQRTLGDIGFEKLPSLSQCNIGNLSPWNLLLTLVNGPLLTLNTTQYRRVEVHLPNPTPSMVGDLIKINGNIYTTTSWISLLNSLGDFPIKVVRHVWLAALFFFPTSGPMVVAYLHKEIDELSRRRNLADEKDEDDAKETYQAYCRVLNCFFRHLPLCFSVDLFRLFLTFLDNYIKPDDTTLDNIYKTALQRFIGHSPSSTDVWKTYIRWKSDRIHDTHQRREWVRKMYIRVLRTPLNGLQEVKEDYDFFLKAEYRGRPPPEGRLEERFLRAKGAAVELNRFMGAGRSNSFGNIQSGDMLPRSLYLPRPVKLSGNASTAIWGDKEEAMRRLEVELWSQWTSLIDRETSSSAYIGMELFGYERMRFFLAMRCSFFPHQTFSWISYADYCLGQQPLLSEVERQVMAKEFLEKACFLLMENFYLHVIYCDFMLRELGDPELAHRSIKQLIIQQRQLAIDYIKKEPLVTLEKAVTALENITLLSINWMRWGSLSGEITNTQFIRLVARFTMHRADFLSLIMGVIRRSSQEEKKFTPSRCQQAFNTFCHFWIRLELVRNQAYEEVIVILQRWKDHLKMFLSSAKNKGWSLVDCGLDDYFFSSCTDVCHSYPSAVQQVLEILNDLRNTVVSSESFTLNEVESVVSNSRRLRDVFFVVDTDASTPISSNLPLSLTSVRLSGATVPLQTYDHHFFSKETAWHEENNYLSQIEEISDGIYLRNTPSQFPVEVIPDDARWASQIPLKTSNASGSNQSGPRTHSDHEVKPRKNKRPPNRRALVTESVVLKDLRSAIQTPGVTSGTNAALGKLQELLTMHLPSTYETDTLFNENTVDVNWLLGFLEQTPAIC